MVEESEIGVHHGDAALVTGSYHSLVIVGARWGGYVLHTTLIGPVNVVPEWEEGIRAKGDTLQLGHPLLPVSL